MVTWAIYFAEKKNAVDRIRVWMCSILSCCLIVRPKGFWDSWKMKMNILFVQNPRRLALSAPHRLDVVKHVTEIVDR